MKPNKYIQTLLISIVMTTGALAAQTGQQTVFGFFGAVDSFDRSHGTLIVDDLLFHINESTLVYKKKGQKGTLSDIRPGVKVGFYPDGGRNPSQASDITRIWILPANWNAQRGYAETPDE